MGRFYLICLCLQFQSFKQRFNKFCLLSIWLEEIKSKHVQHLDYSLIYHHLLEFLKKDLHFFFQAVEKQHSPTPSQQQGWLTPSPQHAVRATWASVAVTGRSRATTIRRRAGSGEAALLTSSTALSSLDASWMPARLKRLHAAWWTYITMRQGER